MIEKPEVTKIKERANLMYRLMKSGGTFTKQDMCGWYDWEYNSSNDRRVRDILALLKTKVPIVATSDQKGYKIVRTLDECKHQINEIYSRIEALQDTLPPLMEFKKNCL